MIDLESIGQAAGEWIISFELIVRAGKMQSWCFTNRFEPSYSCAVADSDGNIEYV